MQGCASDIVSGVNVGVAGEDELELVCFKVTCGVHEQIDAALHDRFIDWESVFNDLKARIDGAFLDGCIDDLFCSRKSASGRCLGHIFFT